MFNKVVLGLLLLMVMQLPAEAKDKNVDCWNKKISKTTVKFGKCDQGMLGAFAKRPATQKKCTAEEEYKHAYNLSSGDYQCTNQDSQEIVEARKKGISDFINNEIIQIEKELKAKPNAYTDYEKSVIQEQILSYKSILESK